MRIARREQCNSYQNGRRCQKKVYCKGKCRNCYTRWMRNGSTKKHASWQLKRPRCHSTIRMRYMQAEPIRCNRREGHKSKHRGESLNGHVINWVSIRSAKEITLAKEVEE